MPRAINGPSLADLGDTVGEIAIGHLDPAFRMMIGTGPKVVSEKDFVRLISGHSHPFSNFGMLAADADEAAARRLYEALRDCPGSAIVFYAGKQTNAVDELAKEHGFDFPYKYPAMAVEIDQLRPPKLRRGYTLQRIGAGAELSEAWTVAFAEGFGFPVDVGRSFGPRIEVDDPEAPIQYFAITRNRDQRIVATSVICLANGIAGAYCVATIREERRKGFGAHVTAEPMRQMRALGYRVGVLQASKDGIPVYARLGFRPFEKAVMYMRSKE